MSRASLMLVSATFATLCLTSVSVSTVSTQTPRFYPDDPIAREPESQNASGAKPYAIQSMYEMTYNLFVSAGHKPSGTRARDINSIDEVPDSGWFTNRIGPYQTGQPRITTDAIARGPIAGAPPDPSRWVLLGEKTAGVHPGFRARDARGETWFVELDPKTNPEGATAAVTIATKLFWALGYNQVETFITTFDPKLATIDPAAKVKRPSGKKTAFTQDDLHSILETGARNADGTYRIVAGRLIPGKILGNFLFSGTRSDDPNDIVPHEDRRELRGLRVFGAWTNLTDLKAGNTLDSLVTTSENGRSTVKHYLQDVGSTFGMCNDVYEWDLSYEYFYDGAKTRRRFLSLGFALSPWQTIPYVEYPSIGKFEGDHFDPRAWRPQTPTTAYMEMRDDDAFWAARRVAGFSEEMIRAAVHTGQFSDPAAERYLGDVLIKRQRKIAQTYLTAINPIVDPRLDANGRLTMGNAAVDSSVANIGNGAGGVATYRTVWMRFDNATGATSPIGETRSATTSIDAPRNLPVAPDSYIQVDLSMDTVGYPAWRQPVHAWFRRGADGGWTLAGFERVPSPPQSPRSAQITSTRIARRTGQ